MAGEFILTFAIEGILTKVSSLAVEELSLAWGFKSELKKLSLSFSSIQDFLGGAADHRQRNQGKALEDWVTKLKHIAEDADNLLDDFNYELLRRKVELQNHIKRKVLNFLSISNPLLFRLKMAHKIKKINASLVELKNEAAFINLVAKKRESKPGGERLDGEKTDSYLEKDEKVVGREAILTNIVETLIKSENNQKNLSVMAIVGMPGLGKTTLAKAVYNEPAISTHFNKKIWVCVSNTFEVDTILSQMVDSLIPKKAGIKSHDALLKALEEELKGKRYVMVLDDVWNENTTKWESLISSLSKLNGNPGSSIIVTTRSVKVASISKEIAQFELGKLSDDECWSILKQRALFSDGNDPERAKIGREIALKCGGVPLVAKVLGGMMRTKNSTEEWLSIQKSQIWELPEGNDRIMSVLRLSFQHLQPPLLRQCFAYCSVFKEDCDIEREKLIQLWMAQGLLHPCPHKPMQQMEDIGDEYFNTLYQNSLFQDATMDDNDIIRDCKMHDLVRDLAKEVSKGESLLSESNNMMGDHNALEIRHVSQVSTSTLERLMPKLSIVRSLVTSDEVPNTIFLKLRALRVLDLEHAYIQELPKSIGKLKHLRYLDISGTYVQALPKSIGRLYNLQTLRMQGVYNLEMLPREMQNLINLRHLYFDKGEIFPAGMFRRLTNLRTFRYFKVGKETGRGIEELGGLKQLKGKLTIRDLENVRDEEEAKKAKLEEKENVLKLSFIWTEVDEDLESCRPSGINDENVLEGLQPHTKLEILKIKNFMGDTFPSWMMRNPLPLISNMKKLLLVGCRKCEGLPIVGHLRNLIHVVIDEMDNLKCLGSDFYGLNHVVEATQGKETMILFPALKTLEITCCAELSEWLEAPTTMTARKVVVFPCLEKLELTDCPLLRNAPSHFPCLKELEIENIESEKAMTSICNGVSTLTSLWIHNIKGLTSLSTRMLNKNKNLKDLTIRKCKELTRVDLSGYCANLRLLAIYDCEKLEHLAEVPNMEELEIISCPRLEFIPIAHGTASLRSLRINGCKRLSSIDLLDHCTSLQVVKISSCGSLASIPISQGLASLQKLEIWRCAGLLTLPSGIEKCSSLEQILLRGLSSVATISFTSVVPSLRKLKILDCQNLSCLAVLEYRPSLQELVVGECPKLSSISFSTDLSSRHCLEKLFLLDCNGLQSLPDFRCFTSLEELRISRLYNLESIPDLKECTSLCRLKVWYCEKLKSLSTCLARMETMQLGPFWNELESFPGLQVPSQRLVSLELKGWPKLKSLPQQVQHFTSLTDLTIASFDGIEALPEWLGNLAALVKLVIYFCGNLKYLPSLEAMQCLTNLQELHIENCRLLKERCTKDSGEEWPKISHIQGLSEKRHTIGSVALGADRVVADLITTPLLKQSVVGLLIDSSHKSGEE